ncbi:MAG: alpha/beta fold hydrolase [Phycisphaerales bacterium]|nr:alpha/beta fold hydrolase [Phycisphaerales bacterium]
MKISLALWIVVCVCGLMMAGCTHMLAERMVAPPNGGKVSTAVGDPRQLRIPVGPPGKEATLAAWVVEPEKNVPVRATVLVLHGIVANHHFVMKTARELAAAGYRSVAVDLRGHGQSTGGHLTYGVVESADLSQVVDYLQSHQLLAEKEKIGVYGCSYGAATAIQFAAKDPRVAAVVAVASFASLRDEAPHFARTLFPLPGLFLSDRDYEEIIAEAGRIAGFDPSLASPMAAISKTKARVLLIHGELDAVTPADHSRRIHAASTDNSELRILPGLGHMIVSFELVPEVLRLTRDWFDANLQKVITGRH